MVQLSHPYMTTGKTIALARQIFVSKVMCLLFNMLSRFVIAFLPRSKHLLILWWQSLFSVILEPKKIKSASFHFFFPVHLMWTDGPGFHDLSIFECWVLSQFVHSPLSPSSSLLSATSAYLSLLIFHLAVLIPACDSFSPACNLCCPRCC